LSQHKSRRRWLGANGKGSLRHQAARKTTAGWVLGVLCSLVAGGAAVRWDWPTETDLADRRGRASPRAQLRLARLRAVRPINDALHRYARVHAVQCALHDAARCMMHAARRTLHAACCVRMSHVVWYIRVFPRAQLQATPSSVSVYQSTTASSYSLGRTA
jgi:hypothetical protein